MYYYAEIYGHAIVSGNAIINENHKIIGKVINNQGNPPNPNPKSTANSLETKSNLLNSTPNNSEKPIPGKRQSSSEATWSKVTSN